LYQLIRVLVSVGPMMSPDLNFAYAGRGNFKLAPLDVRSIWFDDDQLLNDVLLFAISVCAKLLFAQTLRTVQSVNSFQDNSVTSTFLWRFHSNLPMITAIRCDILSESIRNVNDGSHLVVYVSPILWHRDVHLTFAHVSLFVGSWSGRNIFFASLCLLLKAKMLRTRRKYHHIQQLTIWVAGLKSVATPGLLASKAATALLFYRNRKS